MSALFIVRQPIYNRTRHVYGYELIYRRGRAARRAGKEASRVPVSQAALSTFVDIGLDDLTGARMAFVRLSRDFLRAGRSLPLPGSRMAIEVPTNGVVDKKLIRGMTGLAEQGCVIVLNAFVYREASERLLRIANIVTLDIQALSEEDLRQHVGLLQEYGHLKLLASKVEMQEEYEVCRELGFHLFQGAFFSRPRIIKRKRITRKQAALVQLLSELQRSDTSVARLETLINRDTGLRYKLLRFINSAFFGLAKPIESIQRATVLLGTQVIQHWSTLLVMARIENKPQELMVVAVVRARMCVLLAEALGHDETDVFFTIGLMSVLDALFDMEMDKVLGMLTMDNTVKGALLTREGDGGTLLDLVLHYELAEWRQLARGVLDEEAIKNAYLQSIAWAMQACRTLLGD